MSRNTVPIIYTAEPALSHPRVPVKSECLSHVGFHEPLSELWLTFVSSGMSYKYPNCPKSVYDELMRLAEIGKGMGTYFMKSIRPVYPAVDVSNRDA